MQAFQSIDLISKALQKRGYTHSQMRVSGRTYRRFEKDKLVWISPLGLVQYPFVSDEVKTLARQKNKSYDYVARLGYSTPRTLQVCPGEEICNQSIGLFCYPLIAKPVAGTASNGLTRNIATLTELKQAVAAIHADGKPALVQEQFEGKEVRITVMNGQVASACLRDKPQLVGDGKNSVAELLAVENEERRAIRVPYMSYPPLTLDLSNSRFTASFVPKLGQVLVLGDSAMISSGASVYNIDSKLHQSYKEIAVHMVQGLEAPFLVVDLLIKDYMQPASPHSYVFLEFNTAPALKLYYSFRDGKHFDIVPRLVSMIEQSV